MKKNKFLVAAFVLICSFAASQPALAKDDFGKIVKHIEVNYKVHRENRFAFGLAGFVVKFWHVAGVKNFKGFQDNVLRLAKFKFAARENNKAIMIQIGSGALEK